MRKQLIDDRNARALILLAVSMLVMAVYLWGLDPLLEQWQQARAELEQREVKIKQLTGAIRPDRFNQKLLAAMGSLTLPADELTQKIRFKRKLEEQFKGAGVQIEGDPQFEGRATALKGTPYKTARISVSGTGRHDSLLRLAETLYSNPYLAGLEEFSIKLEGKDRNSMNAKFRVTITVTTLIGS